MIRNGIRRFFTLSLRRRTSWERDVEDEITLHLTLRAEQLADHGMAPGDARDEAIRRFGPLSESRARLIEAARDREDHMRHIEFMDDLRQDVTFALRSLRRQKGWTTVAIATLALGIAATTAVWSAASTLLLHPLSYPGASRVVIVELQPTAGNHTGIQVTITPTTSVVSAWRAASRSFEDIEPYFQSTAKVQGHGDGAELMGVRVLPSFATFAGERPLIGRGFSPLDVTTRAPVVLLAEGLWRARFGADSSVIGTTLNVDGSPRRVIGVMPATLRTPRIGGRAADLWLPLDMSDARLGVRVVGRLRPGATPERARRELDSISVRSGQTTGSASLPFTTVVTTPGQTVNFRDSLLLLTGAVALVLLVACANVAHLMLARAVVRQREIAIRTALGAGWSRLTRQLLTESAILTGVSAALGIAAGYVGLRVLVAFRPSSLSELRDAHFDWYALALVVAVSVACGIAFGLVAAINMGWRQAAAETLKGGAVSTSPARSSERLRSMLVVSEMAMSAVLLVGAMLLVRTVINLQRSDLGFDARSLYGVTLDLPSSKYPTPAAKADAVAQVEGRLRTVAGIRSVAIGNPTPGSRMFSVGSLAIEGEDLPPAGTSSFIDIYKISPNYFSTIGARLVDGHTIGDTSATSADVVINAGFARRHWPTGRAVGHRVGITFSGHTPTWLTVVGVVADVEMGGPTSDKSAPVLYVAAQESESQGLFIRTDGKPAAAAGILRAVRSLGPDIPPTLIKAEDVIADSIAASKFLMTLLAAFTVLALVLASVGLYGVMAYAVAQRTREIGIRIALGASAAAIARSVIVRGALLASIGAMGGLILAIWGTRLIEGSLFGVKRLDVPSFVVGALLLVLSAIVACVAPTRRAVKVDPITAIRAD